MRKGFLIALLGIIFQPSAHAFCNRLPRLICAEYANSGAVLIAKLVVVKHYAPPHKQDWHIYSLQTDKVLRGKIENEFRVYEENSSGRATFDWIKGESYLLFLDSREDGTWWLYGCGNSTPLGRAARVLEAIESMKTRRGGLIQGMVGQTGEAANFKDARVIIKSDAATYRTTLDQEGKFRIHLPAGHYFISVSLADWSFEKDLLDSYEDPANVMIEDGTCAEVSFRAKPRY